MNTTKKIAKAMKDASKAKTSAYDTTAVVKRIEGNTAWVHIPGGVDETPVRMTINAKVGDSVQVRVSDGSAWLAGNASAPPTDDTTAFTAVNMAGAAKDEAESAHKAATEAWGYAEEAKSAAATAETHASEAKVSAQNASEYASRALGNLSTVQSVAETLTWITQHGTMALTTDVALDPTHVYFVQDAGGDYVVGGVTYAVVTEPDVADIGTYYELTIDESLNNYVGTHLALTSEGLWLIPEVGGNKVLIATGGVGHTYEDAGTYIIDGSDNVLAQFLANGAQIGQNNQSRLELDSQSMRMVDRNGNSYLYVSDLRGSDGKAHIVDTFTVTAEAWEIVPYYLTYPATSSDYTITVSDGSGSIDPKNTTMFVTVGVTTGATITAEYDTESEKVKAYTIGMRGEGDVGASSSVVGTRCVAKGKFAYAEGLETTADGYVAHAEGWNTTADGSIAHAEGTQTTASGQESHAEGYKTTASGRYSHAEGILTTASGMASHAQNNETVAGYDWQTVIGKYNDNQTDTAFEIGNGNINAPSNALTVDWSGDVCLALDTTAASGTDHDLYAAITALGWQSDVIV